MKNSIVIQGIINNFEKKHSQSGFMYAAWTLEHITVNKQNKKEFKKLFYCSSFNENGYKLLKNDMNVILFGKLGSYKKDETTWVTNIDVWDVLSLNGDAYSEEEEFKTTTIDDLNKDNEAIDW